MFGKGVGNKRRGDNGKLHLKSVYGVGGIVGARKSSTLAPTLLNMKR